METIDAFIEKLRFEKTANTKYQDGFPLYIQVNHDIEPMSSTVYETIFNELANLSFPKEEHVNNHKSDETKNEMLDENPTEILEKEDNEKPTLHLNETTSIVDKKHKTQKRHYHPKLRLSAKRSYKVK